MPEGAGNVIYLNGASSSGKSTIARELQKAAREPYLHVSIDGFLHQLPASVLADQMALARELPRLIAGFNASAAAIARAGNNIIVDSVLQEPSWVVPCAQAFHGLDVLFVAVRCPLETVERREIERGDRPRGLARYQHDRVHSHGTYDIEVDTSAMPIDVCVCRILEAARSGTTTSAFRKLASGSD